MAVRGTASQRRGRGDESDTDDDGSGQPQAGSSRQRQQQNGGRAGDNANKQQRDPELEALKLDKPDKTLRHLFLQTLMSRKVIPLDTAKTLYKEQCRLCKVQQPDAFETFIAELEPGLSLCGLDIKTTRNQETGVPYIALVNTIEDDVSKLATDYKAEEIALFRAIVEKIMTAPKLSYSTTQTEAVRLAKAPVTKAMAIQLLKSFLAKGWLSLHSSGRLTLSPRSLLELAPYLRETFSQGTQEDDDDTPEYERDRTVVDCNLCMTIVTSGYACPNKRCGVRLHTYCATQRLGNDGRCPDRLDETKEHPCQQTWPRDSSTRKFYGVPVGISAVEDVVGSDDDNGAGPDASSMMASSSAVKTQPKKKAAAAAKGGKKKAAPSKKRGRAAEVDDEDEEDELDDDEDASSRAGGTSSPTAPRKRSSRTAARRGTAARMSEDDDDDEE
ncbi:hypothetical protein BMF94_4391 [Rhodotorula taiwanensis]|uniref:Non-structural maintenance of chromosomes element 1 homolog n=1 Tax=Rhodotorula taiwanensis TaxID=741276 RepID=A0A2S5B704_9BASI|nr:hypothetical protein BMF94_4391 [Rhodotorula taiwanensis]